MYYDYVIEGLNYCLCTFFDICDSLYTYLITLTSLNKDQIKICLSNWN